MSQPFAIITDSTADLTPQEREDLDIFMVPLTVTHQQRSYRDQKDISSQEFYELMKTSEVLPTSSQPAPTEFMNVFEQIKAAGYQEVLACTLSRVMSGTFDVCQQSAEMAGLRAHMHNSKSASGELALHVMAADFLRKQGKSASETLSALLSYAEHSKIYFIPQTLDNLIKGGRLSRVAGLAAGLLSIKVVIGTDEEGQACAAFKGRGLTKAIDFMMDEAARVCREKGRLWVRFITTEESPQYFDLMRAKLLERGVEFIEKGWSYVGPSVAVHAGPGAFGISFGPALDAE